MSPLPVRFRSVVVEKPGTDLPVPLPYIMRPLCGKAVMFNTVCFVVKINKEWKEGVAGFQVVYASVLYKLIV
jgi:hypothetical protein